MHHKKKKPNPVLYATLFIILIIVGSGARAQQSRLVPSEQLASITRNYWKDLLKLNPLTATENGVYDYNDQLEIDISPSYSKKAIVFNKRYLDSLKTIDFDRLPEQDLLIAEILKYKLNDRISWFETGVCTAAAERPVDQFVFSFPTRFAALASGRRSVPFKSVKDYENWIQRMKIFPVWVATAIENMNSGILKGNTSPRAAMVKVPAQLKAIFEGPVDSSVFYKPILAMPDSFSVADKERLKQSYIHIINEYVNPAYKKLHDYFVDVYIPKCRTTTGLTDNAGGKKEYLYWVKFWTTSDTKPDDIFDLGIREVARIRKEMDSLRIATGFTGDLPAFFEYVRTDRKFFPFKTEEEVLDRFRSFKARMEPALKKEFNLVPKAGFEIRATEKFRQAGANAEYTRPSPDGTRPGIFYEVIPDAAAYNDMMMETLFLHEAIPGHHFQIALQQEMDAPRFMQASFFGAFSEGWGLYAETLGKELGMYGNPYQYLGRLSADIERAVRLVVDVGMHSKGWTREQAIQYVLDNQPVTRAIAEQRIERYMVIPGQALSYKTGEQKMLSLRRLAQKKLGKDFDIREFHDQILKDGAMPFTILEKKMMRWMDSKMKSSPDAGARSTDSGQFIIHRHLKIVGKEAYQLKSMADGTQKYTIDCFYADRGKEVPLKTTIVLSALGEPMQMVSKGFTSRMSEMNDTVIINRDSLVIKKDSITLSQAKPADMFPVDGYAPATMQALLVKWWMKKGKPSRINGLFGPVEMRDLGSDTLLNAGGNKILSAIGIKDVIWGWEFLWIDEKGELVALCTINAGLDKIEFIRPDYEDQLNFFARQSAVYGVEQYIAKAKVQAPPPTAIIHGVLVDMETGTELPDAAIIIINGKISWTGPTHLAVIPLKATVIDAKGRRMLPGLWDMHAHLKQVEWGPAYIAAGITTARDMANEFDFINTMKSSIDAGKGIGPNILRAGIIDGPGALGNGINIAETAEQGVAFVKKYKAAGFEQVKIYGSLQPAVIKAVCDEAHRQGLTVAGHIPNSITTIQGVEMGIDMIAHIIYIMKAFEADSNLIINFDLPVNEKALQLMLDKKTVVDPTLALFELVYHPLNQPMETIEPAFNTIPATLQGIFTSMGLPSAQAAAKIPVIKGYQKLLFQLHKAGVPIVAGTDMIIPGYSLYRELELYVAAGLTPLEALQCATTTPARVMGLLSSTGSLKKGKDADIILVDGNPLAQISDIRKISLVFRAGRLYNPTELHRMIGFGLPSQAN